MTRLYRALLPIVFCVLSVPAAAAVNAWLDQNIVAQGDSVQLTLQHDGQTSSQPDLSPLRQDFDILGRSSGSSIQIINGKMSAQVQIDLTLSPKRSGKLTVPPLQWDGQSTPPLTLVVGGNVPGAQAGSTAAGNAAHVFITATLDQKQPYVQAADTLTVRLYTDQPLYQASLELQPSNDVLIQQLGQDSQTSATRNGRAYRVIERKYLLFPQRSGEIRLDGPVLNAQVQNGAQANPFGADPFFNGVFGRNPFGGMLNATKPLRVRADPIVLNVRPRPTSGSGHDWLPAQKVTLEETWQPADGPIHVGDPITRHLRLSALGLTASQLPDLSLLMPLPDGLRAYPDQAKLNTGVQGDGVVGTRDQDIALIASRSGRYRIPALRLHWWDTTRNLQREVDLPARTIDVLPNSQAYSAATMPAGGNPGPQIRSEPTVAPAVKEGPTVPDDSWPWVSLALAVLWIGTVLAWWLSHRRGRRSPSPPVPAGKPAPSLDAGDARRAFRQACRHNEPQTVRRHLLDWARAVWPEDPPSGLNALARRLDDPELAPLLSQLDRACYANGDWCGEPLLEAVNSLPDRSKPAARPTTELAGLYP